MHVVVPDASVILKWALPSCDEPNADRALLLRNAIRDDLVRAVVPSLWLYEVGYTVARIFFGSEWPPGFATTTLLILLSLSLNAIFLGVIGEYVGRIYQEVRKRPISIIERRVDRAADPQRISAPPGPRSLDSSRPA